MELKIGCTVRSVNIEDPDHLSHDGMVGKVIGYDPDHYKGGEWPWQVKMQTGVGWYSATQLEVLSEVVE